MKVILLIFIFILISATNSQECGQTKILGTAFSIGSEYSTRGQWPWLAPMFYTKNNVFFCGSTIISKRHLLTASHCFKGKGSSSTLESTEAYAILGKFNLEDPDEPGAIRSEFSIIKLHDGWDTNANTYDGDVAIVVLKNQIIFTNFIQPACLPEPNTSAFEIEGTVVGYGISDKTVGHYEMRPKHVEIESVTQEVCLFSHEVISRISSMRMFCAGKVGKNPCKGDSGGGFYVKTKNSYTIIGIVSSSIHNECHENQFVLFSNVPKYVTWIKNEIVIEEDVEWTSTPLKCKFEYDEPNKRYECFSLYTLESTTPHVRISSIEGSFVDDKTYEDVDTINIKEAKVTYIPDLAKTKNKFPNFLKLYIVLCGLKFVERSKLAKLPQLQLLNFYGNDIEHFDADVFDDLTNLEILAFVKNKIKFLQPKLVANLPNLKEIWSYDNPIEAIPIRFFKNNKKLEKAWMGYSKIKKIGVNFKSLPNLNLLDLRSNECINEQGCKTCALSIEDVQDKIDEKC